MVSRWVVEGRPRSVRVRHRLLQAHQGWHLAPPVSLLLAVVMVASMVVQEKKKRCQELMTAHATLKKLRKAIGSGNTRMQRGNPGALPVQLPRTSAHCDVLALHSQLAGRLGG